MYFDLFQPFDIIPLRLLEKVVFLLKVQQEHFVKVFCPKRSTINSIIFSSMASSFSSFTEHSKRDVLCNEQSQTIVVYRNLDCDIHYNKVCTEHLLNTY